MPSYLNPAAWLLLASELPRPSAIVLLVASVSLLALGLRGFRYYAAAAAGLAAYTGGLVLAKLMYVTGWYVGAPAFALGAGVAWAIAPRSVPVLASFLFAALVGLLLARGFDSPEYYWAGFAGGAFAGLLAGIFAPRFSVVLLAAVVGSGAVVASVGAVLRAPRGPFAVVGWQHYPLPFLIVGTVLVVLSVVAQGALVGSRSGDLLTGGLGS